MKPKHLFLSLFSIATTIVILAGIKTFFSPPTYLHAKIKVSQGIWWASQGRPKIWFLNQLKKGLKEQGLLGNTIVELESFTYYPHIKQDLSNIETNYNLYLNVKLKTSKSKDGYYTFKRDEIGIGSPINLNFPTLKLSGTIINLSEKPLEEKYIKKTVYLTTKSSYPWEYNALKIGDTYHNGDREVFKVLDKKSIDTQVIDRNVYGRTYPYNIETRKYITIKTEMLLKEKNDQLFFGEEQQLIVRMPFDLTTSNFNYTNFFISKIE